MSQIKVGDSFGEDWLLLGELASFSHDSFTDVLTRARYEKVPLPCALPVCTRASCVNMCVYIYLYMYIYIHLSKFECFYACMYVIEMYVCYAHACMYVMEICACIAANVGIILQHVLTSIP